MNKREERCGKERKVDRNEGKGEGGREGEEKYPFCEVSSLW